jgi:hypothetical protein
MMRVVALLGKRDEPTDALEEYCHYLGEALRPHEVQLTISRVAWDKIGWPRALEELRTSAAAWKDTWVIVQYTAIAWSSRGFPRKVLRVLKILNALDVRTAMVFHDPEPVGGSRLIDHFRRSVQTQTMREALRLVKLAILTVQPSSLSWLKGNVSKNVVFIPVGANLPLPAAASTLARSRDVPTVGVFSITGGEKGAGETHAILSAVRYASERLGKLRLLVFGRHAELSKTVLEEGLRGLPVELSVEGVSPARIVVERLHESDVLLFVRGLISTRRGSAIAGISCGLPVIAYAGRETAPPITEAGLVLIPEGRDIELGPALARVLSDANYRGSLASRSRSAHELYFSWNQIACDYLKALNLATSDASRRSSH